MRKVIAVVGPVCSGKTTYMENMPADWIKLDIGTIVRSLTKTLERVFDKTLDQQIIAILYTYITTNPQSNIIVSGIRQVSIAEALEQLTAFDDFTWIYLDVPQDVLEERYIKRAAEKDLKLTYQQAIAKEVELGWNDLIRYVNKSPKKVTIKYNDTRNAIQANQ